MRKKALRYFVVGLLVDAALVVAVMAYVLADIASGYEGRCGGGIIFGGSPRPCTRLEFVGEQLPWFWLVVQVYRWVVLVILASPPLLGLALGVAGRGRRAD